MRWGIVLMIYSMHIVAGGGLTIGGGPDPVANLRFRENIFGNPIDLQFRDGTFLNLRNLNNDIYGQPIIMYRIDNIKFDSGEVKKVEELELNISELAELLFESQQLD
jgi:hypothetical protein